MQRAELMEQWANGAFEENETKQLRALGQVQLLDALQELPEEIVTGGNE